VDVELVIAQASLALRERGERLTGPRRAVLAVLAASPGHLSAEQVFDGVSAVAPGVHRASVYRSLEALTAAGLVSHVHVGHQGARYHLADAGRNHLHASCQRCGVVIDLAPDALDAVAADLTANHGFRLDPSHVALSGICRECLKAM